MDTTRLACVATEVLLEHQKEMADEVGDRNFSDALWMSLDGGWLPGDKVLKELTRPLLDKPATPAIVRASKEIVAQAG